MTESIIPRDFKDKFWAIVKDCLLEFHGLDPVSSSMKVSKARTEVEGWTESRIELYYHGEPFDVACSLAGQQLDVKKHLRRYLAIRDEQHGNGIADQFFQHRSAKTP